MNATYLTHAAEIWTTMGPTGNYAEVIRGEVQDHGGNILFSGTAGRCVSAQKKILTPTVLVPTEWRAVAGEVAGADYTWQLVTEQK